MKINGVGIDYVGSVWFATEAGVSKYHEDIEGNLMKGDLNGDELVNVLDVVLTVNIILGLLEPSSEQEWAADMNDDAHIDILDAMCMVNEILGSR
jgi:hypothetical protein